MDGNIHLPVSKSSKLSTQLWSKLSAEGSYAPTVTEISENPGWLDEIRSALPRMADAVRTCGGDAVRLALQPLVLVFGAAEAAKAPGFWEAYIQALDGLPARALKKGIADYTSAAESQFFPKPGPLLALCLKHADPMRRAFYRAEGAIRKAAEPAITEADVVELELPKRFHREVPTENDRQRVRRMADDFTAAREAAKPAPSSARPNQGATIPGHHITPQLRAVILGAAARDEPSKPHWGDDILAAMKAIGAELTTERQGVA